MTLPKPVVPKFLGYSLILSKRIDRDFIMMREFSDIMIPIKYGYSYWKWIKDFLNVDCFLYWNRKDLLPYWYFLFDKVIRCIKKL